MINQKIILAFIIGIMLYSCDQNKQISSLNKNDWSKRKYSNTLPDSITKGTSYLSVYSEIYSQTESKKHDLVVTASIRNTNINDTIFIDNAKYFNTKGELIRTYFDKTIYVAPLETIEIIIDETDNLGGSGANFLFDWKIKNQTHEPFFEAVMISTYGQQGLSFTTQGKRIK